jgi:hypothetical protein
MRDEFDRFPVAVAERRPAPAADNASRPSARELAQRRSGDIDVLLLWHPDVDRIELCVLYLATGVSVHVDVAPDKALDAFNHPYAYVTQRTPGPTRETDSEAARWE